eukprot:scaffold50802_cov63-Phaeocystis_antarctica.AAC.4
MRSARAVAERGERASEAEAKAGARACASPPPPPASPKARWRGSSICREAPPRTATVRLRWSPPSAPSTGATRGALQSAPALAASHAHVPVRALHTPRPVQPAGHARGGGGGGSAACGVPRAPTSRSPPLESPMMSGSSEAMARAGGSEKLPAVAAMAWYESLPPEGGAPPPQRARRRPPGALRRVGRRVERLEARGQPVLHEQAGDLIWRRELHRDRYNVAQPDAPQRRTRRAAGRGVVRADHLDG